MIWWMSGQVFNLLGGAVRATLDGAAALFGLHLLLAARRRSWRLSAAEAWPATSTTSCA